MLKVSQQKNIHTHTYIPTQIVQTLPLFHFEYTEREREFSLDILQKMLHDIINSKMCANLDRYYTE